MKTPQRGWSAPKPQSNSDREHAGLNPHIRAKSGLCPVPCATTLESNPERVMDFKDMLRLIKQAQKAHPEQPYVRHAYLHHYEGISIAEVASMMDAPRSTAKSRIESALKFLKRYIHEHE